MRRDYDMIVRHFSGDEIEIYPIGDVHLGAQEHRAKEWKQFCDSFLEKPNAYLILVGDLIDNGTRSGVTDIFKATMPPSSQKRMMAEMLAPLKDRIIAVVPGNHCARSGKDADDDPCLDICSKLDIEDLYRPNAAFIKVQMGIRGENGANRPAWTICAMHGAGGGIYTGASVNRAERFAQTIDGLNILILGHSHKSFTTKPMKIVVDPRNEVVSQKPFFVVSVGSWMEFGGYAMRKMLLPSSPALQVIRLNRFGKKTTVETV